jgi:hypothetical protein
MDKKKVNTLKNGLFTAVKTPGKKSICGLFTAVEPFTKSLGKTASQKPRGKGA